MLLSFIIPVYNCAGLITRCIKSIEEQAIDDYEIILIVDGSPDNSFEVCTDLSKKYSNITVLNQTNQGTSCARNNGLNIATGKYIWFVDADDYIPQNFLPKIFQRLSSIKYDVIAMNYIHKTHTTEVPVNQYQEDKDIAIIDFLSNNPCLFAATKIYNRESLKDIKFLEGTKNLEDMYFNIQYLIGIDTIHIIPECGYIYDHTNENSTSLNISKRNLIKKNQDTVLINKLIKKEIDNIVDNRLKTVLTEILNKSIAGHLYSLMNFYTPKSLTKAIDTYQKNGLYPIKKSKNKKIKKFLLIANHKEIFITSMRLSIFFKKLKRNIN